MPDDKHICGDGCNHGPGLRYTPSSQRSSSGFSADNPDSASHTSKPSPRKRATTMSKLLDSLTPGATHEESFANGLRAMLALDERFHKSGVHGIEERFEAIVKHLESAAKSADKAQQKHISDLVNVLKGAHAFFDDIRDHHAGDAALVEKGRELRKELQGLISKHASDPAALAEAIRGKLVHHSIPIPGMLMRAADLPLHTEYVAQVKEYFGEKKLLGKGMAVVFGTASLGVVAHGAMNVKRGIFGYQDIESGEHKSGALSTLVLGLGEMAAGMLSLKKALTGRWGFGRAVHAADHHHHHHDHDHGHHHH